MICVECGKEGKTYEGLCIDCYLKKKKLIEMPEKVEVVYCRNCPAYRLGNKWMKGNLKEDLKEYIKQQIEAKFPFQFEFDFESGKITCTLEFEGRKIKKEKYIEIVEKERLCDKCSLQKGGYFEAILQIRGANEKDMKDIDKLIRRRISERDTFLLKKEEVKGGRDYYIGNKKVASKIAREIKEKYDAELSISSSLVGMKDGKRIYRDTYGIRLVEYKGKFVKIDDKLYRIVSAGKKIELEGMDGEKRYIYKDDLRKAVELNLKEREAIVLHEDEKGLYIMDTESYKTAFVNKPKNWKGKKKIKIVEYEGKFYAVGE